MSEYKNPISVILGAMGTIFMLAMAFSVMPTKYALFAGVSCYVLAGAVKKIMR